MMKAKLACVALLGALLCGSAAAAPGWTPGQGPAPPSERDLSPELLFDRAKEVENQGKLARAAKMYQKYAKRFPESPPAAEAVFRAADCYERLDKPFKAFKTYQNLIVGFPSSSLVGDAVLRQFELANLFFDAARAKQFHLDLQAPSQAAVKIYERVLENAPFGPVAAEAQYRVGLIHELKRRHEDAHLAFRNVYETYSNSDRREEAFFRMCRSKYRLCRGPEYDPGKMEEAVKLLRSFLEEYRTSPRAEHAREMLEDLRNQMAEAQFLVGKYYERNNKARAAMIHHRSALMDYGESSFSEIIRKRMPKLREMVWDEEKMEEMCREAAEMREAYLLEKNEYNRERGKPWKFWRRRTPEDREKLKSMREGLRERKREWRASRSGIKKQRDFCRRRMEVVKRENILHEARVAREEGHSSGLYGKEMEKREKALLRAEKGLEKARAALAAYGRPRKDEPVPTAVEEEKKRFSLAFLWPFDKLRTKPLGKGETKEAEVSEASEPKKKGFSLAFLWPFGKGEAAPDAAVSEAAPPEKKKGFPLAFLWPFGKGAEKEAEAEVAVLKPAVPAAPEPEEKKRISLGFLWPFGKLRTKPFGKGEVKEAESEVAVLKPAVPEPEEKKRISLAFLWPFGKLRTKPFGREVGDATAEEPAPAVAEPGEAAMMRKAYLLAREEYGQERGAVWNFWKKRTPEEEERLGILRLRMDELRKGWLASKDAIESEKTFREGAEVMEAR